MKDLKQHLTKLIKIAKNNKYHIEKLNRIIYLLINNVKIYIGSKGGYYYLTHNYKKIYL
jgi:predicted nucleic acid-binding protein